jgi:hypothetical protein
MQNKPNLCRFWAVSGDYEKKQTQTNPIQTQNKAIFCTKNRPQNQNKPKFTLRSLGEGGQTLPAEALWRANFTDVLFCTFWKKQRKSVTNSRIWDS